MSTTNTDSRETGRLIRTVRHSRNSNYCNIEIEERFKSYETSETIVGNTIEKEVSSRTRWVWRTVFSGKPDANDDFDIALAHWVKMMHDHPDALDYRAMLDVTSGDC